MTMPMKSMTFGKMPSKKEFCAAYERELGNSEYNIKNCKIVGNASYDCEELYNLIKALNNSGEEEKELLASGIMFTLGFEWI